MASEQVNYITLQENLSNGKVAAFVGAGLSIGAGLPDWYALINELAGRIQFELPPRNWASGSALIDAAQAYINREGLHSFLAYIKKRLDTTGISPSVAHRSLAQLPISLIFTTNYDNLLEQAYREAGRRTQVIVRDSSIPYMLGDKDAVNIVKLYGDLEQEDTIVLAAQQYESFFLERPQMIKLLETELARSDMLYLGWSHSDPHFNLLFGEMLSRFGENLRTGYAVMFDVSETQKRELERKHIRVVNFQSANNRTEQLASWLQNIKE